MSLDLRSLIGKLNETSRRTLEGAAGLAVSRTHYDVELEHWLYKLMEEVDSDIPRIVRHFDITPERFLNQLDRGLEQMKSGNSRRPDLAETIEQITRDSWVWCSVNYNLAKVRSGGILLAALSDARLKRRLLVVAPELGQINLESLERELLDIVAGSKEDREVSSISDATQREPGTAAGGGGGQTPSLDRYTRDLTAEAREGRMDPVLAREPEVRQIVDILGRRRQNNPIMTGEAGVGKTAVVEGFAQKIVAGDVPEHLQAVSLRELDMGLLQAGAGVKGEFENRLKQVIEEVRNSATPIVLFIDEIHSMVGAGGAEGQNDAANLLKPALARGELRTIGATTWSEYKKYFEKDPALTRRFQVVKVDEPSEEMAIRMMRGVAAKFEEHHGVQIKDEALVESVRLSHRYIPARQLPDKSVSVLDTACAKVATGQAATPAAIEDRRARRNALETERANLDREQTAGEDHGERSAEIEAELLTLETEISDLESRWEREKDLVSKIHETRSRLVGTQEEQAEGEENPAPPNAGQEGEAIKAELDGLKAELAKSQEEEPLVLVDVDGQAIAEVISSSTGIPVGKMVSDEILGVLNLADTLKERVIGQDHGLQAIAKRIHTARASLDNPSKPVGVFLLLGPSGVGKTETALALAESMFGGEQNTISINMSEYQESHTVSSLKGSPPGYVGYGEGGVLTEAVRRRPYSVVLLDEVEKAHPDVMELFFQVFDKGLLEDGEGREIDFKNTVIILTSNVGSDTLMKLCADPDLAPEPEGLLEAVRSQLLDAFPAALLGRLVQIPYYPVSGDVLRRIIALKISHIVKRVKANHGADLIYGEDLVGAVLQRCTESESGARAVDNILTNAMLPQMAAEVLSRMAAGTSFSKIEVGLEDSGAFSFAVS
jgi:type VI secretion system protein VasG